MQQTDLHLPGIPPERVEQYREEIEKHKDDASFFITLGDGLVDRGQNFDAITYYKRAIEIEPKNPAPYNNLGNIYRQMGWISEAEQCYRETLRLKPDSAEAWNNLGVIALSVKDVTAAVKCFEKAVQANPAFHPAIFNLGLIFAKAHRTIEAIRCHERVIEMQPNHFDAHLSLGASYGKIGPKEKSLEHYTKAHELNPAHAGAMHMLNALKGVLTNRAPRSYVEDLFDSYAGNFEEHLVEILKYNAPQKIREMINQYPEISLDKVLDLGCGTGVSGKAVSDKTKLLVGVDVSKKMIAESKKKNIYHRLAHGDAVEFLKQETELYDVVIAADMLVYVGALEELCKEVSEKLNKNGIFAISTETFSGEKFVLRESGRYAHSHQYIAEVSSPYFTILKSEVLPLRKDLGSPVEGEIFLLKKSN